MKDRNVPGWRAYFMSVAESVAQRSKDPNTKVGAVIIDTDRRIVSTGYNGFPSGMEDRDELWKKPKKYDYVIHAEMNALLYARRDLNGCFLAVTLLPCPNCAKHIAAAGISRVYYKHVKEETMAKTFEIFDLCGVNYENITN